MNSPNLITVPLPPAKGRSIGRIRADQARGDVSPEAGRRVKTGENSRPINGQDSTPLRPRRSWRHGEAPSSTAAIAKAAEPARHSLFAWRFLPSASRKFAPGSTPPRGGRQRRSVGRDLVRSALHAAYAVTTWFCDAYASWQKGGVEKSDERSLACCGASALQPCGVVL
jgi:hypothetical protein